MTALPSCLGLSELFDSTDELDHLKAKTLCGECPMRLECAQRLEKARARAYRTGGQTYGPQGTWAGKLIGAPRTSVERIAAEDAMFTDDELRAAHAAWSAGVRDDRTRVAERIYQRKRSRQQWQVKKAKREAA